MPGIMPVFPSLRQRYPDYPTDNERSKAALGRHGQLTLTSMYVQVVIDTFLCAVFTIMLYTYWIFQGRDRLWTRALVIAASFMGYLMTGYVIWFVQHFFVENFGWYGTFFETTYFAWFPVLDAITTSLTQGYTGHRAWRLNDHNWVFLIVVNALLLVSFAGAVWTKVQLAQFDHLVEALRTRRRPMTLWLAPVMVANILITVAMLRGLVRTGRARIQNESRTSCIIRLILESQLPATLLTIAFLIQVRVAPTSLLASTFQSIQGKLYLVSLIFSLNGRVSYSPGEVRGNSSSEKHDSFMLRNMFTPHSHHITANRHTAPSPTYPPPCHRLRLEPGELEDAIPLQEFSCPPGMRTRGGSLGMEGHKWSDVAWESPFAHCDDVGAGVEGAVKEAEGTQGTQGRGRNERESLGVDGSDRSKASTKV